MAPRTEHHVARPTTTPTVSRITPAAASTDRTFKVLQSSRAPAQLPLFPPPGSVRGLR